MNTQNAAMMLQPISVIALLLVFALTGCSSDSKQANTPSGDSSQPLVSIETTTERLPPDLLAEVARDDLFEPQIELEDPSKNPQNSSQTPDPTIATGPVTPTVQDPFAGISLVGVVKLAPNKGMAILQTEADGPTRIVKYGETFTVPQFPSVPIRIAKMGKGEITLSASSQLIGGKLSKTITLDRLIGYRPKNAESKEEKAPAAAANQSPPIVGGAPPQQPPQPAENVQLGDATPPA